MNQAPGPSAFFGFYSFPGFAAAEDRPARTIRFHEQYGDVVRHRVGSLVVHFVRHPDHVKHVLQENHSNYLKGRGFQKLKLVLGEGLLTSEGDFWRRQRRLAQPAFHNKKLTGLSDVMVRLTSDTLSEWEGRAEQGAKFELLSEMMRLTLEIATQTLFSSSVQGDSARVKDALSVALTDASKRFFRVVDVPLWVPTKENRLLKAAIAELDEIVFGIIARRRALIVNGTEPPPDLLSMLMAVKDEDTGESMSDRQLRDEVMTLFLAGHETTANALAWSLYLLDRNPECREKLEEEVDEALGGRLPTFADVQKLPYTKMCFEESLRMFPPAWIFGRKAIAADKLGGFDIPAGSFVVVSPYAMHRNPAFFPNPRTFDPLRFLPEESQRRHKYAYLPFGGGPRICIGNSFALTEGTLVLAMIAAKFRVSVTSRDPVVPVPTITLRPKGGIDVSLAQRKC